MTRLDARRCDRCGKEGTTELQFWFSISYDDTDSPFPKTMDVCGQCMEGFRQWRDQK